MAFATADDVGVRLGRTLTQPETDLSEQVIESVTAQIASVVGRDADWADDLDPVPVIYKQLCIEKAVSVGSNPNGLAAFSEAVGAYNYAKTYRRTQLPEAFLSPYEEALIAEAAYGTGTATARSESIVDDLVDYAEDGVIDDD